MKSKSFASKRINKINFKTLQKMDQINKGFKSQEYFAI